MLRVLSSPVAPESRCHQGPQDRRAAEGGLAFV